MTAEITEGTVSKAADIAAAPFQPKGWLLCQKHGGTYWAACYPMNSTGDPSITPNFLFKTRELAMERAAELATAAECSVLFKLFYLEF